MHEIAYKKGDKVRYIPNYANGDNTHGDCENGVVSSISRIAGVISSVFVKYDNAVCKMETGDEPYTSQSTNPLDLVPRTFLSECCDFKTTQRLRCYTCEKCGLVCQFYDKANSNIWDSINLKEAGGG